jgi:FSR family fosmidomycin resistance protein-like MFS transporter
MGNMGQHATVTQGSLLALSGLMLAHFTNDFYANFLPVFIPLLRDKFQLSFALVALLSSSFTAASSFLQLAFGYLSDRAPHWPFALVGPLVTGAFMSVVGALPSYGWILIALLLAATGTAMFHPQATALSGRLFASRKGLYVSLFISAGTLGFALGPALMALLLDSWGLEYTPMALLPLVMLGLFIWLMQRGLSSIYAYTQSIATGVSAIGVRARATLRPHRQPLLILWGLVVLRHAVLLAFITFFLILLGERGADYLTGSFMLFAFLLIGVLGGVLGGHLSDRWGRWPVVLWTFWMGFPAMIGFLVTADFLSLMLLLLGGTLLNASNPVIVAQAQELVPEHASTASAIVMGVGWGVGGLLVSFVGVLADVWGNIEQALLVFTLAAFALTALLTTAGHRLFMAKPAKMISKF